MTIEKGRSWGGPAEDPSPASVALGDAELADMAAEAIGRGTHLVARLTGGDLLATLGISGERDRAERAAYPIDLAIAELSVDPLDSQANDRADPRSRLPFVAHLTARRPRNVIADAAAALLGHGPGVTVSVMNAAWLGDLRLGPKAHPNDGLLDVTEGRVRFAERREAMRRARSGSHLPHPALRVVRSSQWGTGFDRPTSIWLDGVDRGQFRSVRVSVIPDALTVVA